MFLSLLSPKCHIRGFHIGDLPITAQRQTQDWGHGRNRQSPSLRAGSAARLFTPLSSCNLTQGPLASLALELHELLPRHPKASTQALSRRTQLLVSKDKQEKKRAEQAEQAAKPLLFCRHSS